MRTLFLCCCLCSMSCGSTARALTPMNEHTVVDAEVYDVAETHFSGDINTPATDKTFWSDLRCQELLDKRDALVATTAGICGLTGASGLGTVIPQDASKELRLGFGITTLALGTVCTSLTLAARSLTARFEQYCSVPPPVAYQHPASDEVDPDSETTVELIAPDGGVEP